MTAVGSFHVHPVTGLVRNPPTPGPATREQWDAEVSTSAPRVPWDVFLRDIFEWKQGEHLGIIAPTQTGKTTLLIYLLPLQPYVVVFATKPYDPSMDRLISSGYLRLDKWQSIPADKAPYRVLWPDASRIDSDKTQRVIFEDAIARIYRERGWCIAIDEGYVFTNDLKLDKQIKTLLTQGASLGIGVAFATQRPFSVPVAVYDQSTHLFFGRDNDERNLSRISGISWRSAGLIRGLVANLEAHQFLYINTRTGAMARTRVSGPLPTVDF